MITRSLRTTITPLTFCALATVATACGFDALSVTRQVNAPDHSLMGVRFGDSFDDVERRFPLGQTETSPHGARAIRIEDASSQGVDYQDAIYEFSETSGMQMVIAHFDALQDDDVYKRLQTRFGAPAAVGLVGGGAANEEASWQLADGSGVFFSGPKHRLVMLGADGSLLKVDIRLRDLETPKITLLTYPPDAAADPFSIVLGQ